MDVGIALPDNRGHPLVHRHGRRPRRLDFYHGNDEPGAPRVFHNSRTLSEHGVITMPYLKNLNLITKERFTLIGLPLAIVGAEASPVRAVALL